MQQSLPPATVAAIVGALALWGCGGGGGGGTAVATPTTPSPPVSSPAPTGTVTVTIVSSVGNAAFQPNPVRANTGDTVMFRNADNAMHHLVMDDGSADLGDVAPGATSRGFTLRSASAANFHCTLHSSMVGSINGALPEPPPCIDPYGYGC